MVNDPESMLGTPSGYASPQQLEMARQLAATLMQPQQGQMQHWSQPMAQIVRALLGAKMMQGAGEQERANAAGMMPLGGPQMAESGAIRSDAPQMPAGASLQQPGAPTGQPGQPTPGLSATPQSPSGGPPPEMFRQPLVTRDMVQRALISQSPMASKLYEMYLEQQQPQIKQIGDAFYSYIPARPDIPPQLVPQPHKLEKLGGQGVPEYMGQFQQTPDRGFVQSPIGQAGGAPPTAAGGGTGTPSQGGPSPGGIQTPTDFPSAAKAAVDITGQKKQAELDATTHNKIYNGIIGKGVNAAEQQQNIQLAKAIMEDPGYQVGGTGANLRQSLKSALATSGLDPNAATPRKLVDMLGARILQQQLASLRSSTSEMGEQAGRIFATQVAIEEKALLNSDDPDPVIRAKLNILDQEARLSIAGAKMAHEYHSSHGGRIDSDFVNQYIENISKQRMTVPPQQPMAEDTSRVGEFAKPVGPSPSGWSGFRRVD